MPCQHGEVFWWNCLGCREDERLRRDGEEFEHKRRVERELKAIREALTKGER